MEQNTSTDSGDSDVDNCGEHYSVSYKKVHLKSLEGAVAEQTLLVYHLTDEETETEVTYSVSHC